MSRSETPGSRPPRRDFLNLMSGAGAGLLAQAGGWSGAGERRPLPVWRKHGEQFRHRGEPAEGWVQNFTSTVEPLPGDRWRVWTSVSVPRGKLKRIGYHTGLAGGRWNATWAVATPGDPDPGAALAIGGLPEGWQPVQPVTLRLKDGRTRLYFWAHGASVVRYLAADSQDGRAFRVVNALEPCLYHPADRAVDGKAALAAGLSRFAKRKAAPVAGEPLAPAALISNDATNVYQLADGSFEMYSVGLMEVGRDNPRFAAQDNLAGLVRVIDRYTSADGLHWGGRRRVLTPDEQDPQDLQFYYLSVTHTATARCGLLGHYRLNAQTIDLEPCLSVDGLEWERPWRQPLFDRDPPGATAGSFMLHAPHALVQRHGEWHLFYTGGNFSHNHRSSHGVPARAVLLATGAGLWDGASAQR